MSQNQKSKKGNRTSNKDADNRRFAGNVTLSLILAGTFALLVVVANRYGAAEPLSHITVVGASVLESQELVEHLNLPDSVRIEQIDLVDVERQLVSHPFVKSATAWSSK